MEKTPKEMQSPERYKIGKGLEVSGVVGEGKKNRGSGRNFPRCGRTSEGSARRVEGAGSRSECLDVAPFHLELRKIYGGQTKIRTPRIQGSPKKRLSGRAPRIWDMEPEPRARRF